VIATLQVMSPLAGWCASLDEVPDAVFAGRMLGDGLAVDPTVGLLVAPCAGQIVALPESAHAVSIRTAQDIDILLHIGIDTVALGGRGFQALVRPGTRVELGEPLIRFDLDTVARGAKSLMTPVVISLVDGMSLARRHAPGVVSAGELLFEVSVAMRSGLPERQFSSHSPAMAASQPLFVTRSLLVSLRLGLHARPAALLAHCAKTFGAELLLAAHGRTANARSVVAIMALGVRHHDELTVHATGADAAQAVAGVIAALEEALRLESVAGHAAAAAHATAEASRARLVAPPADLDAGEVRGVVAVPGFAVGRATRIERRVIEVSEVGADITHERAELGRARTEVRTRLQRVAATGGATRRDIIEAHLEFLDDPSLNDAADELIAVGKSAGFAWRGAIRRSIGALEALDDPRLRERADDLLDMEAHVLLALSGEARPMILPLPEQTVIIAEDLLPSELTALDRQRLVGICLGAGGATSHVSILAAAMGIPMMVGLGTGMRDIADGSTVILDAERGILQTAPSEGRVQEARRQLDARRGQSQRLRLAAQADCYSRDGTRIEVFANLGNVQDASNAVESGAEGCGLLRTEFLFLDRDTAPTEEEQREAYQAIARVLEGRPMILRLMDVGGDKPLRYLPLPAEENPALGLRGVRTSLARPDLLRTQLRAVLRVAPLTSVRLLLPMITDSAEIGAVRGILAEEMRALQISGPVEVGAMIETPAAALMAARLIHEVDFLSVGSNDLTQYTLAMDRGHAQLAQRTDALHPAVLKLIASTTAAGVAAHKVVAVCGGVAADRLAAPILLGLGVRELSVVPGAIPAVKRVIRGLRILDCRDLAFRCLELDTPAEVRALVAQSLSAWGEVE
jgi:multiphosphoryl transfer protein